MPFENPLRSLARSTAFAPLRKLRRSWQLRQNPIPMRNVPTMLAADEVAKLYELSRTLWNGSGVIVDAGCFLGGSTTALGCGLQANPALTAAPQRPLIETYDLFEIEAYTLGQFFPKTSRPGASFLPDWRRNTAFLGDLACPHVGDVTLQGWDGRPVEILFIDLAKHWTVSDHMVSTFFPRLIAGHSVVVQQDYLYESWNGWLHVTMELFAGHFEIIDAAKCGSVFFKYTRQIPAGRLSRDVFASLGRAEIRRLMALSIARFSGSQKALVERSAAHMESVLDAAHWPSR